MKSGKRRAILVVDQDQEFRECMREVLKTYIGGEILTASNVEAALDILENEDIACVITDMDLGEKTGSDLLAEVTRRWPEIPVHVFPDEMNGKSDSRLLKNGAATAFRKTEMINSLIPKLRKKK